MSVWTKIPVAALSRGALDALERLLAENAALKQALAELRAEVAKPSGMDQGTEPKPAKAGLGALMVTTTGRLARRSAAEADLPSRICHKI